MWIWARMSPHRRPGEGRDPYAAAGVVRGTRYFSAAQQLASVVMGPGLRRDGDEFGFRFKRSNMRVIQYSRDAEALAEAASRAMTGEDEDATVRSRTGGNSGRHKLH